jgi:hypothetical protein
MLYYKILVDKHDIIQLNSLKDLNNQLKNKSTSNSNVNLNADQS